jgi:hypothetical protein
MSRNNEINSLQFAIFLGDLFLADSYTGFYIEA